MYTVTRQVQHPDGLEIVEVSLGDINYTNPDMLVSQFPGEGESYFDPIEAADNAIAICRSWRQNGSKAARVGYGATGGNTIPFEACTFKDLQQWAKERHKSLIAQLGSCDRCGATLWDPKAIVTHTHFDEDRFCSEFCAEEAYAAPPCPEYE